MNLYGFVGNDGVGRWDYLGEHSTGVWKGGPYAIIGYLIYLNVEIRITCSKCECMMLEYALEENGRTLHKLRTLRAEAEYDSGKAKDQSENDGFVNLGNDFGVAGVAGGVGIVNSYEESQIPVSDDCLRAENAEILRGIRADFELKPVSSILNEGAARVVTGKLDNKGEMSNENAKIFLDAMIERQKDVEKDLLQEIGDECYDK